jgi:hypothetical protein
VHRKHLYKEMSQAGVLPPQSSSSQHCVSAMQSPRHSIWPCGHVQVCAEEQTKSPLHSVSSQHPSRGMHSPRQTSWLLGHAHRPELQLAPRAHSDDSQQFASGMQRSPHFLKPSLHMIPQRPPLQVALPPCPGVGHGSHIVPHAFTLVLS